MKKIIVFIILFALILVSCQSGGENSADNKNDNTGDNANIQEPNGGGQSESLKSNLPDINFGGADFNILMRVEFEHEFNAEHETGDVVNDAVYKRNITVEEKFGVNIKHVPVTGNFSQRQVFIDTLRNSVLAGDGAYDMVAGGANYLLALSGQGLFLNLLDSEYIDFGQQWWSSDFAKNMAINNVLYTATGDIALNTVENMIVMFFNKQLCTDYGIELPYQIVKDGKWTLDKLEEFAKLVSEDLDGDGKMTEADKYGYMLEGNSVKTIMFNMGANFSERGDDGLPKMTYMSERMINIFDRMQLLLANTDYIYKHPHTGDTLQVFSSMQKIFSESRMLFMSLVLSTAQSLRAMEVDFGIIPMPKYDEAQEKYRTVALENLTIVGIPASVKDPKISEIILEAFAFESIITTVPAYYDISLKMKQSRDEESGEMLDLIRSNMIYDFAYFNGFSLSDLTNLFNDVLSNNGDIVSTYDKRSGAIEKSLNDLIESYQ